MTASTLIRDLVIKGYLNGKSFEQLSDENAIAKGSVFNIINDWKGRIKVPDIEELREFSVMVRKSGITIKECAQSFRFIQILSSFGITDELDTDNNPGIDFNSNTKSMNLDERKGENKGNSKWDRSRDPTLKENFYYFIEDLYNNCKKLGIKSYDIIQWIQDLREVNSLLFENNGQYNLVSDSNNIKDSEVHNPNTSIIPVKQENTNILNEREIPIPFVSKVNSHVTQNKIKVKKLAIIKKRLQREIKEKVEQKNMVVSRVTELEKRESLTLSYLSFFNTLKKELSEKYGLKLADEVRYFAKIINDFKYYGYDAYQIINKYKQIESLRDEREFLQTNINSNTVFLDKLVKEVESLEKRVSYSSQSIDAYQELDYMGFRLKELKHLHNIIMEITSANDISYYDAIEKFLNDIENQYDNKLGFETKINELKSEKIKIENELPGYKEYLRSQSTTSMVLQYLYSKGVTNDDIINMNSLISSYINGEILFNPDFQNESRGDIISNDNKLIKRAQSWKSFINEIKNLGNINFQIIKQSAYLDELKVEIDKLNSQRQKLNEQTLLSGQILNTLFSQHAYFVESLKQIMTTTQQLNKIFILSQSHFLVCVVITGGNSKKGNDNINERQDE